MWPNRSSRTFDGSPMRLAAWYQAATTGLRPWGARPGRPARLGLWTQDLKPGDIVTCTGNGPGFGGDPGYGAEFTTEQSEAAGADSCMPHLCAGSLFDYGPAPGALVPIDDGEQQGKT